LRINSAASGSERASFWVSLATTRGTGPAKLSVPAIANCSKFHGREFRLTDMEGVVVNKLLA